MEEIFVLIVQRNESRWLCLPVVLMSGNGFFEQLERSVADFWGGILLVQLVHLLELLQEE